MSSSLYLNVVSLFLLFLRPIVIMDLDHYDPRALFMKSNKSTQYFVVSYLSPCEILYVRPIPTTNHSLRDSTSS